MGESRGADLQVRFDRRIRMEFQGANVTFDAGLSVIRELERALGLTELAEVTLADTRMREQTPSGFCGDEPAGHTASGSAVLQPPRDCRAVAYAP